MLCRIWRCRFDDVDLVHVDDADRADAGRREVQRCGRSEAAGTEHQHLRLEQLHLAGGADLGQQEVALVAVVLLGGQRRRLLPRAALVLPATEAALHRLDVGEAELARASPRRTRTARHRRSRRRRASSCRRCGSRSALSRCPRGMWMAPGIAPSSYSSGSRTSSTSAPAAMCAAAPSVSTSRISDFAAASRSRNVAIPKGYQLGQDSDTARTATSTATGGVASLRSRNFVSGAGSSAGRSPQS